jgi:hypothetical protein
VAVLSSLKVKALTFADSRISSSLRGVGSIDADDAWLLELLRAAPFLLANLEVAPDGEKALRDGLSELILAPQQLPMAKHGGADRPRWRSRRLPSGTVSDRDSESSEMECGRSANSEDGKPQVNRGGAIPRLTELAGEREREKREGGGGREEGRGVRQKRRWLCADGRDGMGRDG